VDLDASSSSSPTVSAIAAEQAIARRRLIASFIIDTPALPLVLTPAETNMYNIAATPIFPDHITDNTINIIPTAAPTTASTTRIEHYRRYYDVTMSFNRNGEIKEAKPVTIWLKGHRLLLTPPSARGIISSSLSVASSPLAASSLLSRELCSLCTATYDHHPTACHCAETSDNDWYISNMSLRITWPSIHTNRTLPVAVQCHEMVRRKCVLHPIGQPHWHDFDAAYDPPLLRQSRIEKKFKDDGGSGAAAVWSAIGKRIPLSHDCWGMTCMMNEQWLNQLNINRCLEAFGLSTSHPYHRRLFAILGRFVIWNDITDVIEQLTPTIWKAVPSTFKGDQRLAAEMKVRENEIFEALHHWFRDHFIITSSILQLIILSYVNEAEIRVATFGRDALNDDTPKKEKGGASNGNGNGRGGKGKKDGKDRNGKKKAKPSIIKGKK
jgi:hypothetical protein